MPYKTRFILLRLRLIAIRYSGVQVGSVYQWKLVDDSVIAYGALVDGSACRLEARGTP